MEKLIGFGAGGHARVIIELIRGQADYELAGLLTPDSSLHGSTILGVPVLGNDDLLPALYQQGIQNFVVGVGGTADNMPRKRLFEFALWVGMHPVTLMHSQAIVSPSAKVDPGTVILAGAILNAGASVGSNCIVNTGAIIEHDCVIGDHVHVATGARLAGMVRVEDGAHIGIGASIKQGLTIGVGAVVGAGAVVVKDVAPGKVVVGVPARPLG
jgi:sugar O-acyltransferase (sialic acid O-acetyltransferase NeuD family)